MSRHQGVSCDVCMKENFKGKRYKCLLCFDYDLCETCYERKASSARHISQHPMQCILTKYDCELYFGGEQTFHLIQSFTCPYCCKKGFNELELAEHVILCRGHMNTEVICPVCAANSISRTNPLRDDFITHITVDHRNQSRELISFFDETPRQSIRRIQIPNNRINAIRGRRSTINYGVQSNRDISSDSIAEFLTHISGRRIQGGFSFPLAPERPIPIRNRETERSNTNRPVSVTAPNITPLTTNHSIISLSPQHSSFKPKPKFLLKKCLRKTVSERIQYKLEETRADKSLFVSSLILDSLNISTQEDYLTKLLNTAIFK